MAVIREALELTQWRQPAGTLKLWVRVALGLACVATIVLPFAGARVLWSQGAEALHVPSWVFQNALAAFGAAGVFAAAFPRFAQSRYLRLALLLPIVHIATVAIAWPVWLAIANKIDTTVPRWYFLAVDIPMSAIIAGELVIVAIAAWCITRRRRDAGASHAFIMIALVDLLLLGLWLPLVAWAICRGDHFREIDPAYAFEHVRRLTVLVVAPPLAVAIGYTAIAMNRVRDEQSVLSEHRTIEVGVVATLFVAAFGVRADAEPAARVVYANYIHVMLGALVVAAAGPVVLAITMWWRTRLARRRLRGDAGSFHGILVHDDRDQPVVGCHEIASWLRPPRARVRSFVVATASGEVPVHGARMIAPIDPATTVLSVGESFGALRAGDRVRVSSSCPPGGAPFRTAAAPIVGSDPMIAPYGLPQLTFSDLALALWRPTVAYLVILVAIAVPALAALATAAD
jgi:hypothetical protein